MPYYYGNYGSENRGFLGGTPPVTRNLIILNIIVFIATLINREFMTAEFALFYPTSRYFHWWQILTHMFMHGGFWHILFNMYTLWLFGSVVENIIGSKKFLSSTSSADWEPPACIWESSSCRCSRSWKAPPWATAWRCRTSR